MTQIKFSSYGLQANFIISSYDKFIASNICINEELYYKLTQRFVTDLYF